MHRFGRSAQKRMNDRWGGAFILAAVLAVAAAWKVGGWLSDVFEGDKQATMEPVPGNVGSLTGNSGFSLATQPHEFQLHFVQVGAFRSEGAARNLVKALSEANYTAAVAPKNEQGLAKVYVGPYMTIDAANEAKSRLTGEGLVPSSFNVTMTVDYKPEAVMAMTGSPDSELQKGLDTLNAYLYEAGNWFASRSSGQATDGTTLAALGQEINQYLTGMAPADGNPAVSQFMEMATAATENMAAIEMAATAMPGSDEFQAAMNGYVSLLNTYHSFHTGNSGAE